MAHPEPLQGESIEEYYHRIAGEDHALAQALLGYYESCGTPPLDLRPTEPTPPSTP